MPTVVRAIVATQCRTRLLLRIVKIHETETLAGQNSRDQKSEKTMRALVSTVILVAFLAGPVPAAADTMPQADALLAAQQLAQAAVDEAARLRQAGDDAQPQRAASKATTTPAKTRATGSARPSARSIELGTKLLESERLRIRDSYREQQQQLIASRLIRHADDSEQAGPETTLQTAAD